MAMVGLSSVYVNTCDEYCSKNCEDDCDARACNCDLDKSLIHIHDILAAIKAICIVSIASRIMRCTAFLARANDKCIPQIVILVVCSTWHRVKIHFKLPSRCNMPLS